MVTALLLRTVTGELTEPQCIGTNEKFHHKFCVFECMKIAQNYAQVSLIEKSIISRSAKDTVLGSMIELCLGYYGHHKRENNGIVHDFQTHFKSSLFIQLTCS